MKGDWLFALGLFTFIVYALMIGFAVWVFVAQP
jgi:hypothetical protein